MPNASVRPDELMFDMNPPIAGRVVGLMNGPEDSIAVRAVNQLNIALKGRGFVGAYPKDLPEQWGPVQGVGVMIVLKDAGLRRLHREIESLFTFPHCPFFLPPLGYVSHHPDD
jgi:hypothetical protein